VVDVLFVLNIDFLWCWQEFGYSGPIGILAVVFFVFLVRACLGPGLVGDRSVVQSFVF